MSRNNNDTHRQPWWVEPSPAERPDSVDASSVDESLFIDDEYDDAYLDEISHVNVVPREISSNPTVRKSSAHHSQPRFTPRLSSAAFDQAPSRARTVSPSRKSRQEVSSNVANKTSKPYNSVRSSTDRPKTNERCTKSEKSLPRLSDSTKKEESPNLTVKTKESTSPRLILDTASNALAKIGRKVVAIGGKHDEAKYEEAAVNDNTIPGSSRSGRSTSVSSNGSSTSFRRYTVKELVQCLGRDDIDLPPALERRVRDFKFAQTKRRERHGENSPWGIFGLYAHLSDVRADLEWAEDAAWRRQQSEPYLSWTDFEKSRDKGLHNRPLFTCGVITVCSIMLVVTFGVNGWKVEPLNVNPLIGPSSETLIKVGARQTNLIVNQGQWFRLFTPLVLHAGLVHFVLNMAAMYFIGAAVEQSHGYSTAAVLFILPAVGGNILSAICLPQYISVGASGGIFGLIGACLADISINWNLLFLKSTTDEESRWRHLKVLFWLAFDIILNCIIGLTPFVDNFTHLGGFLYGLCCGLSTIERLALGFFGLKSTSYSKAWSTFLRFFGLIVSLIAIMVTTVVLVQSDGVTSPCNGCRYISCVPFPPRTEDKWWYCDDCDFVTADLYVNGAGTGQYEQLNLKCPDGQYEQIDISEYEIYDKDEIRKALPTFCRGHCDEVFRTSN